MPKRYSEPESLGNVTIYMNENSEKTQLFFEKSDFHMLCFSQCHFCYRDHFNNINQL